MYILWHWLHSINVCTELYKENRYKDQSVEGVENSSIYTIRAVMICIFKVLKVA